MILAYILLFLSILTEVFYIRTFRKLKEKKEEQVHIVFPRISTTVLTPIFFLFFWFLGLFFLSIPDMGILGYLCFEIYALHLFMPYRFLGNIIMYNEHGFSIGYPPGKIHNYQYDDITEIITNKLRWDTIYVGEKRILSTNINSKEFKEFKNYILKQRSLNEQTKAEEDSSHNKQAPKINTLKTYENIKKDPAYQQNFDKHIINETPIPVHFHASNYEFNIMIGIVLMVLGIPLIGFVIFACLPEWAFCIKGLFTQITLLTISKVIARTLFIILLCSLGITLTAAGWMFIVLEKREIIFEQTGLLVKYPLEKWKQLPWNVFSKICICYEPDLSSQRNYITNEDTKLCFLCVGENSFWRSHNLFHYRKVFMLPYSEEFLNLVKETSPVPIIDKRDSRIYNTRNKSDLH